MKDQFIAELVHTFLKIGREDIKHRRKEKEAKAPAGIAGWPHSVQRNFLRHFRRMA
jgi:hypothetical protein